MASLASKIHRELEDDDEQDVVINLRGVYVFSGFFDPFQVGVVPRASGRKRHTFSEIKSEINH